jgi:hypothetical protein
MSSQTVSIAQNIPKWDFKSIASPIGPTFVPLGTPTEFAARMMVITYFANMPVIFCFDNTSSDQLEVVSSIILDLNACCMSLPANTQILIKAPVATTTGGVAITLIG